MSGKIYIAAAGSGKTQKIIDESTSSKKSILILTYTITNQQQIINRIKKIKGIIPDNISISTWFSFLLRDGIRPYQGSRFKERIEGIIPINGQYNTHCAKSCNKYYENNNKIYTDKLSDCVIELNKNCNGKVFDRISKIYDCIYIDEVQDLAGYDFEILKCLINSNIEVIMVGDPRQCTYSTHSEKKYKKYASGKFDEFFKFECKDLDLAIDKTTLNRTYRNNDIICEFANKLYPNMPHVLPNRKAAHKFEGVKVIDPDNVALYLKKNPSVQLRDDKRTKVLDDYPCYNFGESKGLEFDGVIIYPTMPIWEWIIDNSSKLQERSRARFYVAVTRAMNSVVIVRRDKRYCNLPTVEQSIVSDLT